VNRKRERAEALIQQSRAAAGQKSVGGKTKPGEGWKSRFWKDVDVRHTDGIYDSLFHSETFRIALRSGCKKLMMLTWREEGLQVHLDRRPVRTPTKAILHVPHHKTHLATAIALEWDQLLSAQQSLKTHYIPLTSLTSRALDIEDSDAASTRGEEEVSLRQGIVDMTIKYLGTDTLLCWVPAVNIHSPNPSQAETLRDVQIRTATAIIAHLTTRVWPGVEIVPVLADDSIVPASQPRTTQEVIKGWVAGLPAYELAGLERAVLATKSLLVAVRLLADWSPELRKTSGGADGKRFGIEDAAEACSLERNWQTGQWGEVEDTHDVEKEDLRRQLGSVVLLVSGNKSTA
jgi:chaperone required for assembly of F1-ATPase